MGFRVVTLKFDSALFINIPHLFDIQVKDHMLVKSLVAISPSLNTPVCINTMSYILNRSRIFVPFVTRPTDRHRL